MVKKVVSAASNLFLSFTPVIPRNTRKSKSAPVGERSRAKVYIDGANIFYVQKALGWSIGWQKVKNLLSESYDVIEFRYYTGVKPNDEKMMKYLRYLDRIGFTPITKVLKTIKLRDDDKLKKMLGFNHIHKSDLDVEMTTDILLDRGELDCVILFTGDSDFTYLVKTLKNLGKKVLVFSSRRMLSWELKLACSKYYFLDDFEKKLKKQEGSRRA